MADPVKDKTGIEETIVTSSQERTQEVDFSNTEKNIDNTKMQAKEGQDALKDNIVGVATAQLEAQSNQYTFQKETQATIDLKSYEGYTQTLSQLIFEIDGCMQTAKYKSGLNQSGKQTLKTAREKLKQYKDIMKDKKRMIEHEFNAKNRLNANNPEKKPLNINISNAEIEELKNRWFRRKVQIEHDIKQGQMGKSSNTAPRPNQSVEQVLSGNRVDQNHNNYDAKLNEALQDAAFLRTIDNNQDAARQILQGIANNSLSDQQIVIIQSNMTQLSPYFEQYGMTSQVHRCIQTRGGRYNQSLQVYGNVDGKTAYKIGGVTGWLNNELIKRFPNVKPEQASNISNIAVAAGGIYAIYRIGKRFFGKNEKGKRNILGKTALLAGGYFVPQLFLGQDGYSLLGDMLSGKADFSELRYRASNSLRFMHNNSPEVYAQMAPGILGMSIFPQTYTVDNIRSLQQTFSDQNARRQWYSSTYNRLNKDNSALASEFRNTFNQNQYNESEWKVFLAKLGITDKTRGDTIVFKEAAKMADKKTSLELWMKSQGKEKNDEFKQEINNYLKQEGEFNPEDLNPNWFKNKKDAKYTIREEDFQNKEKLNDKVDNLPLNSQEKSELKSALEEFYDRRTLESKPNPNDFNLKIEDGLLILTSQSGQEAKIDIHKKELFGFGNGIKYSDFSDLINTADIANKILTSQKGKSANIPPFQYKPGGRGIYFNNANSIIQDVITRNNSGTDTRVLTSGILGNSKVGSSIETFLGLGGATSKVENLYNHPKDFAEYLSKRRLNENKIDIDPTRYPILKKLSDSGINFTNEKEVQELETRLQQIKDLKKFSIGDLGGKPYKTTWKWFDTKLKFINVDGTKEIFTEDISERFPTIMANKDKFLEFMNNPKNGMRGSEIANRTN